MLNTRAVQVGIVVDKATLEMVFPSLFSFHQCH